MLSLVCALTKNGIGLTLIGGEKPAVECCAPWTHWLLETFTGDTLLDALKNAYEAMTGHAFTTPERVASA